MRGSPVLVAVAVVATVLAGCHSGTDAERSGGAATATETFGAKPDVGAIMPGDRDDPPTSLEVVDLVDGEGAVASPGSLATVHYAGARWQDAAELESTWDADEPYVFEIGAGRVIEGWEQGVGGADGEIEPMRVGGRRMLMVPPDQAYGERGAGDDIGPGESLVFIIDLIDVEQAG